MRKEKLNIIIILYLTALLAVVFLVRFAGHRVNPYFMLLVVIIAQEVYLVPTFISKYLKINYYIGKGDLDGYRAEIPVLIPLFGELNIMGSVCFVLSMILNILLIVCIAGIFIPLTALSGILPDWFVLGFPDYCIVTGILTLIAISAIRGCCYLGVFRHVDYLAEVRLRVYNKGKCSWIITIIKLGAFLPGLRAITIAYELPIVNAVYDALGRDATLTERYRRVR